MQSINLKSKKIFLTLVLSYGLNQVFAQTVYSKEVQKQILAVENGLFSRILLNGKGDNIIDRMKLLKVKGLSIAVIKNYKIEWAKGYGFADENEKRLVTTTTLFEPGSISKSLNALGALKLVQNHKMDLDKDINTYLKQWQFPYDSISKDKKITLANLLSHTAGLSVHGFLGYDRNAKIPSLIQILDGKAPSISPAIRSLMEPNKAYEYSGGGTTIIQLMIEEVSKLPYHLFMQQNVLTPLGMTNSFYNQPPSNVKLKQLATGYDKDGNEIKGKFHVYPTQAAAGLWTTPTDLAKYMIDIQLSLKGKSNKVLNKDFTELHTNRYLKDADVTLGSFKQERNENAYFFHDAANDGYRGLYIGSLDGGNGVSIVVNSDVGDIIYEVMNSIANVYNWKGWDKPKNVKTIAIDKSLFIKYVGLYTVDSSFSEITQEKAGLYYYAQGKKAKMHFTTTVDFMNIEFQTEKTFVLDNSGTVEGFAKRLNGDTLPPAKKIYDIQTAKVKKGQYADFGWHLIENKRFDEALQLLLIGKAKYPSDINMCIKLAHCYLFKNEFNKAIQLYKEALNQQPNELASIKDTIKQDFEFFQKNRFDKAAVEKAKVSF